MTSENTSWSFDTKLVHAGKPKPSQIEGAVITPIYQSANFLSRFDHGAAYDEIRYTRVNNCPNHVVLHRKIAALEGTEDSLVASSGMAAITATLFTLLSSGDHAIFQNNLYGGTQTFMTHDFARFGVTFDFVDASDAASWSSKLKKTTKVFYVEGMSNPLLRIPDHRAVVEFAKANGLISVIDNTFLSPACFRPSEIGYDLIIHSATKYLNGHSDLIAGCVSGSRVLIDRIRHSLNHLGGCLDPHGCFLLERGIKTLNVRIRQQSENACKIAKFLSTHSLIAKVNHPSLSSHPGHDIAEKFYKGYGGMLSFEVSEGRLGPLGAASVLTYLKLASVAPSLGGIESLATRPSVSSHAGQSEEERKAIGISDNLIRYSVGLESAEDLINDLDQALKLAEQNQMPLTL